MSKTVFRNTAKSPGRTIGITPSTSPFQYLSAGRIILDARTRHVDAVNPGAETTLVCLHGSGTVRVDGLDYAVGRFDGVYVPRGVPFSVETEGNIDLVESSAPVSKTTEPAHTLFTDIAKSESLTLHVGAEPYYRDIHKIVCENAKGLRILSGVTMSKPGNWTSWPPHEHAATREELYVFFDMPAPAFATQFVYEDLLAADSATNVFNDDAVVIVKGYHPNVAAPGYSVNFCWALCALEEETWRTLANVNVQKGFEAMPTGLR